MRITKESHLDHGLTEAQVGWVAEKFADKAAFFIETVELPLSPYPRMWDSLPAA
jgi:hypothetical protein